MPVVEKELKRLMVAGQGGDAAAYKNLLAQLSRYLRGYYKAKLAAFGRSGNDAEDLVQDTLMAMHTRRQTYNPEEPFTPWMHAIARYKLIDHLRRKDGRAHVGLEEVVELTAYDDQIASESHVDLSRLLERLPEKMKQSIKGVKLDGLSVAETAERFGMSESAVKVNIHRGLRTLANLISRDGNA